MLHSHTVKQWNTKGIIPLATHELSEGHIKEADSGFLPSCSPPAVLEQLIFILVIVQLCLHQYRPALLGELLPLGLSQ